MVKRGKVLLLDSGVGGLSVMAALAARMPDLDLMLCADNAFYPYGNKEPERLKTRLVSLAQTFVSAYKPDVFILACNTATTVALDSVRSALDIPVIGTVPAIKPAAQSSHAGVIGILATASTVEGGYLKALIKDFACDKVVFSHQCPELVSLTEQALQGKMPSSETLFSVIKPLFVAPGMERLDTIVLGCTHFPLLKTELMMLAPFIRWIDSGDAIARRTAVLFKRKNPFPYEGIKGRREIHFTAPREGDFCSSMLLRLGLDLDTLKGDRVWL